MPYTGPLDVYVAILDSKYLKRDLAINDFVRKFSGKSGLGNKIFLREVVLYSLTSKYCMLLYLSSQ